MIISENVPLASLTTFKVGGVARFVAACSTTEDIQTALAFARERSLPWYVIGGGSNILASDEGYEGVIIRPLLNEISFTVEAEPRYEGTTLLEAGAGVVWDELVQESVTRRLWGLENLAGIPGCVGGAPVQNIGAYGADVSDTLSYVDVLDTTTNTVTRFSKEECKLGYRDSRFKHDASYIILKAAFTLSAQGTPRINYADLTARIQEGEVLDTPESIAHAVREIRARKFPDLQIEGTAGSFFKNPIISNQKYIELRDTYPELPGFPQGNVQDGTDAINIRPASILEHILHLRGFTTHNVRCFEQQPLVLVAKTGSSAEEVEALAREVEMKVKEATGISIEREVRMLDIK